MAYSFYFDEDGHDVWMVMNTNGQRQEIHLSQ